MLAAFHNRRAAYNLPMDFNPITPLPRGQRRWADLIYVSLCLLSLAFLLVGRLIPIRRSTLEVTPLRASNRQLGDISGFGFSESAVYPDTHKPVITGAVRFYGSWMGSDTSVGSAHSVWYDVTPEIYIWVAGYPGRPGLELKVETLSGASRVSTSPLTLKPDPGTSWQMLKLPFQDTDLHGKFRIVAVDKAKSWGSWVGFSTPFVSPRNEPQHLQNQLLMILLTASAAIILFISPGLLLRDLYLRRFGTLLSFIWIPVPGFIAACILGLLSWITPTGAVVSTTALLLFGIYLTFRLTRSSIYAYTSPVERNALFVILLLAAIAIAKSIYSVGPIGELYAGTISRTLQVGDRPDSRIPYHIVQLIVLHERPNRTLARALLSPNTFSSRGPLGGLAASPIVLASGAKVAPLFPDQPWMVFDPEGFMAYRIAMIVMAVSCLLMVFGLSASLMSEHWAYLALLATVTTPFVIHEIYFTWPKLTAASFVLLAVYLILSSKYFASGLALGIGYLCHPSALLSVPGLLGLSALTKVSDQKNSSAFRQILVWSSQAAFMLLGLASWIAVWRLVNRHHFEQAGFLNYFGEADRLVPTTGNWIRSRLDSLLNTLVPLNLFLFHRADSAVNSVEGLSPPVVSFFFQPWTGLPFGIGIIYFVCLLRLAFVALKNAFRVTILLYVLPFLFFTIYWGAASTGMLREGLHAWFLAVTIGSILALINLPVPIRLCFDL